MFVVWDSGDMLTSVLNSGISPKLFSLGLLSFKTESGYVAHAGLELVTPQPLMSYHAWLSHQYCSPYDLHCLSEVLSWGLAKASQDLQLLANCSFPGLRHH